MRTVKICCFAALVFLIFGAHVFAQNGCQIDFLSSQSYPAGDTPVAIISADWNEDGDLDLATANFIAPGITVLFGGTAGSFQPPLNLVPDLNFINSLTTGDWNEDGHLDLAAASFLTNSVEILLGDGNGNFTSPVNLPTSTQPNTIINGDWNEDGHLDLVT